MKHLGTPAQLGVVVVLCVVAGYVDALAYLKSDLFVANMTGNTVLVGIAVAKGQWATLTFRVASVALFFGGAVLGRLVLAMGGGRQWAPLLLEALLVAAAASSPSGDWQALVLAAAMGMQSTAVTQVGGLAVNTVVVTGAIARVAERAADRLRTHPALSAVAAMQGRLQGAAWLAYGAGAALGTLAAKLGWMALFIPAAALGLMAATLARAPSVPIEETSPSP